MRVFCYGSNRVLKLLKLNTKNKLNQEILTMVEEVKATASTETDTSTQRGAGSLNDLTGKIELIDDNIIFNEEFKKNVAIPYFKDIYKDLAAQSDAKSKGINKVSILNVSQRSRRRYLPRFSKSIHNQT